MFTTCSESQNVLCDGEQKFSDVPKEKEQKCIEAENLTTLLQSLKLQSELM